MDNIGYLKVRIQNLTYKANLARDEVKYEEEAIASIKRDIEMLRVKVNKMWQDDWSVYKPIKNQAAFSESCKLLGDVRNYEEYRDTYEVNLYNLKMSLAVVEKELKETETQLAKEIACAEILAA